MAAARMVRVMVEYPAAPDHDVNKVVSELKETTGFTLDPTFPAVQMRPPKDKQDELKRAGLQLFLVRGTIDASRAPQRHSKFRIWSDTRLEPFSQSCVDCTTVGRPIGDVARVAKELGVDWIWGAGYTGAGIVVGVVDAGITARGRPVRPGEAAAIPYPPATGQVSGGWPPPDLQGQGGWGTTSVGWGQHGNMMAFDVQAMAPEARLWDIRVWSPETGSATGNFAAYVSNAVVGYRVAINALPPDRPHILTNSWGLYDSGTDPQFAFAPESPLARMVEEALDAGILMLFAAGNCGTGCQSDPDTLCGGGDRGPGSSILGPNGHSRVMTVGAANLQGEWCGYTSQGPAALPPYDVEKPDFCSYTRFDGFFPTADPTLRDFDGGTSAATALAAGVVALLKQRWPGLTQEDAKRVLRETARDIRGPGFDTDSGAGIIQAKAAFKRL